MQHLSLTDLETALSDRHCDYSQLAPERQMEMLSSRCRQIIDPHRLLAQLTAAKESGKPLRIKYGVDPTAGDIHLGHIVSVIVARRLMQMGHHIIIVLGDFTASVGDPTGRVTTRPILSRDEIEANATAYRGQIAHFIEVNEIEFVRNSSFYDPSSMSIHDFLSLLRKHPVSTLLQREDFRKRQESGLTIAELIYPTLMAIDSVKLACDVELGGIDQILNFQLTKSVMEREGMEPQTAITTDLLLSTAGDGKKMAKSEGNYISLRASGDEVYGKLMSIPDSLLENYFTLLTDITDEQWQSLEVGMRDGSLPAMEVKRLLSRVITTWIHDRQTALDAESAFTNVFSRKAVPANIPTVEMRSRTGMTWADVAVASGVFASKAAFRRLVDAGAVKYAPAGTENFTILGSTQEAVTEGTYTFRYGRGKFLHVDIGMDV